MMSTPQRIRAWQFTVGFVLLIIAMLSLPGCGTRVDVKPVETQTVDVPVARPCPKNVDPKNPPAFAASDEAMKSLPFPDASARMKASKPGTVEYDIAKKDVDANVYYLLQIMAADRLQTRAWAGQLATNLGACQDNG